MLRVLGESARIGWLGFEQLLDSLCFTCMTELRRTRKARIDIKKKATKLSSWYRLPMDSPHA